MEFWNYVEAHPVWTLIYICVVGGILVGSLEAIFGGVRKKKG